MPIRTALLSVSDKTGLFELAKALHAKGVTLLSSGGTAKALADAGVPVETVESYTGSPEVMGGRVKTLHPRVHGGILSRGEQDAADLARIGGREIDLVCVNLYPFEKTAADPKSSPTCNPSSARQGGNARGASRFRRLPLRPQAAAISLSSISRARAFAGRASRRSL